MAYMQQEDNKFLLLVLAVNHSLGLGSSIHECSSMLLCIIMGFPCGLGGKSAYLQRGSPGFDPWVGKISWRRERLLWYSGLDNSMDWSMESQSKCK